MFLSYLNPCLFMSKRSSFLNHTLSLEYRHQYGIFSTLLTVQTPVKEGERSNPQGLYEMSVLTAIQLLRRVAVNAFFLFFCPVLVAQPALYLQSSYSFTGTVIAPLPSPRDCLQPQTIHPLLFLHLILLPAHCEVTDFRGVFL